MKYFISALIILGFSCLNATDWNVKGDFSLTMNQNSYSDNWQGEENGSISWVSDVNFLAEKQLTAKIHNKNTIKLAFGQTHEQDTTNVWEKPKKTTDLIDFESMFRFTLNSFVDPFASLRLESQFLDESGDETKNFNPNITTEAFGLAKVFIKDESQELSTRFGAAFKQYFDGNQDESTNDGGLEFVGEYRKPFLQNLLNYNTNLNLYKPLFYSESDDDENDDWKQVRMDWKHDLSLNITKFINLKLFVQLLYDKTEEEDVQLKQTLGLGLNYKLF